MSGCPADWYQQGLRDLDEHVAFGEWGVVPNVAVYVATFDPKLVMGL